MLNFLRWAFSLQLSKTNGDILSANMSAPASVSSQSSVENGLDILMACLP